MTGPILRRLKPWLVPVWNRGHRLARRLGEVAGALLHRRVERCACCGRVGLMFYRRGIIVPDLERLWNLTPAMAEAFARKESSACSWCRAPLRARRLARALLDLYPVGHPPTPARSVRAWSRTPEARALRVAEINRIEGLHAALAPLPHFFPSDYRDDSPPGLVVDGVRHEDLTRLTYPDASLDLVLTSETLEHVPDLSLALSEIHRVLTPGGHHLFTIPQHPDALTTHPRATLTPTGTRLDLLPPLFHPSGTSGYPVFTEFGPDLPSLLPSGFQSTLLFGPNRAEDVAQVYVTQKILSSP